jgi:hypothetical protein
MRAWVDRYVIWLVVCALLTARGLPAAEEYAGPTRAFFAWVVPASQTLTLMALYRWRLARVPWVRVAWILLSRWLGRWIFALAVSVALYLALQALLPPEWVGLSAIPVVAGSIGATAYLLYRMVMDIATLLERE